VAAGRKANDFSPSWLNFRGKEFVRNHHLTLPFRPLVPDAARSVGNADLDGSLIIHGDNRHALKALLPRYADKVDGIFLDRQSAVW
jgi:adenine-specific DNA-methyltransferase